MKAAIWTLPHYNTVLNRNITFSVGRPRLILNVTVVADYCLSHYYSWLFIFSIPRATIISSRRRLLLLIVEPFQKVAQDGIGATVDIFLRSKWLVLELFHFFKFSNLVVQNTLWIRDSEISDKVTIRIVIIPIQGYKMSPSTTFSDTFSHNSTQKVIYCFILKNPLISSDFHQKVHYLVYFSKVVKVPYSEWCP